VKKSKNFRYLSDKLSSKSSQTLLVSIEIKKHFPFNIDASKLSEASQNSPLYPGRLHYPHFHLVSEMIKVIAELLDAKRVNAFVVGDADDLDGKIDGVDEMKLQLLAGEFHFLVVKFLLATHDVHL
jgi:hypothetical protein